MESASMSTRPMLDPHPIVKDFSSCHRINVAPSGPLDVQSCQTDRLLSYTNTFSGNDVRNGISDALQVINDAIASTITLEADTLRFCQERGYVHVPSRPTPV